MARLSRVALAIIRAAVHRQDREWILGDTLEEYGAVRGARGSRAADRWLLAEAARIVLRAPRARWPRRQVRGQPPRPKDALMQTWLYDTRYALRVLSRAPGFALASVATLALGIGASATVFSVVRGVVLEPLPYAAPDRLVRVFDSSAEQPKFPMSPANFKDYRDGVGAFEALAAYEREDLQIGGERPEQLRGMRVTPGFFTLLGWRPALGRDFRAGEERPGQDDVAILSDGLWRRRFGADPAIVGRTVRFSDRPFVIVGVMPPGFQHVGGTYRTYGHGNTVDVWWVRTLNPVPTPFDRNAHFLNVVGRVREGVTIEQARAELAAASARLAATLPNRNGGWGVALVPLRDEILGSAASTLGLLLGAVQLVLLLACVNVAGLLLGRATERTREIGVRAALGATRARLVGQLVVESLVLAVAGGALGIALAAAAVRALPLVATAGTPRLHAVSVDWTVAAYAAGVSALTALLFGLAPALHLARARSSDTLKGGGRGTVGAGHRTARGILVAAEIAVAFVLVVGASLLVRSFARLSATDHGFEPRGVLTARFSLPAARYPDRASGAAFYQRLRARILSLPGVEEAGLATDLPWTGYDENTAFGIVGRTFPQGEGPEARFHMATPGYFRALRVPVLAGRDLAEGDVATAPAVVVVNERLARRYWGGAQAALGVRLELWGRERAVVGVVGDIKDTPWAGEAEPALYFPQAQQSFGDILLAVRASGDPNALVEPITRAVRDLDPALPLANVAPLDRVAGDVLSARRFLLALVGAFAVTALALAVVGVYGMMAHAVGARVQEFGVRQALGATRADIGRIVLRSGAAIGLAGAAGGILLGVATTRLLAASLYGISPLDPLTFATVAVLLVAAALVASLVPARRATRVDPAVALRGD
jgi:predicted permease